MSDIRTQNAYAPTGGLVPPLGSRSSFPGTCPEGTAETGATGKNRVRFAAISLFRGGQSAAMGLLTPPVPFFRSGVWRRKIASSWAVSGAIARAVEGFTGGKGLPSGNRFRSRRRDRVLSLCMSDVTSGQLPYFTLGEAARQAGVSKPTLSKAISSGRLSAEKQPDGSYRIQPAELFRVYPPEYRGNRFDRSEVDERETGSDDRLAGGEIVYLRERLALLTEERERERAQLTDQIRDLRQRLDAELDARRVEAEERRKLTSLLTDQRQSKQRRWWWGRKGDGAIN
jgi:excisionase family DNA binding protein